MKKLHTNREKPILLSGMQPSGQLTLGNYIGAIKNWLELQKNYQCLFMLVDLHTITVKQNPEQFRQNTYDLLAMYLACGLDPEHHPIFLQSHVPEHAQLAWVLNCYTYMGELNRMTQFKDKSQRHEKNINVGLFSYPVLMAADILLYDTNLVPVGDDQKQHLELARDIALRFNNSYGNIFIIPEPYIPPVGARIMSLQEPNKKMSKSDINPSSYINLLDDEKTIFDKFKRAVTDSGKQIVFHPDKPGIGNLMTILSTITGNSLKNIEEYYQNIGYGKFKTDVAEAVINLLKPIQQKFTEISKNTKKIDQILADNAEKAREIAIKKIQQVYDAIGFIHKTHR